MKCARKVCQNEGVHPHKHMGKLYPDNYHYCKRCAKDINAECVRFGDEEVFDLSAAPQPPIVEGGDHENS